MITDAAKICSCSNINFMYIYTYMLQVEFFHINFDNFNLVPLSHDPQTKKNENKPRAVG